MFSQIKRTEDSDTIACFGKQWICWVKYTREDDECNRSNLVVKPNEWCVTLLCCPVISNTEAFMDTESADTLIYNPRHCTCERHLVDIQLTQIDSPVVKTECIPTSKTIKDPVTCLINLLKCHLLPGPHLCLTLEPQGDASHYICNSLNLWSNYQQLNCILGNVGISVSILI